MRFWLGFLPSQYQGNGGTSRVVNTDSMAFILPRSKFRGDNCSTCGLAATDQWRSRIHLSAGSSLSCDWIHFLGQKPTRMVWIWGQLGEDWLPIGADCLGLVIPYRTECSHDQVFTPNYRISHFVLTQAMYPHAPHLHTPIISSHYCWRSCCQEAITIDKDSRNFTKSHWYKIPTEEGFRIWSASLCVWTSCIQQKSPSAQVWLDEDDNKQSSDYGSYSESKHVSLEKEATAHHNGTFLSTVARLAGAVSLRSRIQYFGSWNFCDPVILHTSRMPFTLTPHYLIALCIVNFEILIYTKSWPNQQKGNSSLRTSFFF